MAGSRIAGITIEIDGNTTKLQSALKNVNSTLNTTKNALKDVDKLLKFNPGNADLLRQKQQLLTQQIENTKTKLDTLREAMDQMKNSDGFDENSQDAQNLQREIIDTETALRQLEEQAKQASSVLGSQMQAAGESIKNVGENITNVGESLSKNITAPITALGGASIAAFNDVDGGLDSIVKKTGATGEELAEMQTMMEEIATSIPTSFETAGDAIGQVATRFDLSGSELQALSEQFIKFAEINDTDVVGAINGVQSAMAMFDMETDSAGDALDILTKASQDTGTSIDEVTNAMVTNGTALKEMGFGFDTAAGFLASLNENGVDASSVMTGLKRALQRATAEGKPLDDALAELQESMIGAADDTEAAQIAMELFGNKAGPTIADAVRDGRISFDELSNTVTDWGNAVSNTFEKTQDPIDSWKTTLNQVKLVGADLGATLGEVLAPILEKIAEKVKELRDKWNSLSDSQKELIIKIAGIAAAVGPILVIFGKLTSGVGSLVAGGGKLLTLFSSLGGGGAAIGAAAGPILGVVAAVAALIAIFATLWQNNEDFREQVTTLWETIKEKVSGIIETLKVIFSEFVALVSAIWDQWGEQIMAVVTAVFGYVSTFIDGVLQFIRNIISVVTAIIHGDWSAAWEAIKATFSGVWETIKGLVSGAMEYIRSIIALAWEVIKDVFGNAWEAIKTKVSTAVENIKSTVSEKFEAIKQKIITPIEQARDKIKEIIDRIKGFFSSFNFQIPHIKLPHLQITGELSLVPPSVPKFSVEWYKKAYDNPYLFSQPTVIGYKGFGDGNGSEMVYGHDNLMRDITDAMARGINSDAIYNAVREGAADSKTSVVIGTREFARILKNMGVVMV